jgi:sodium-dependent dicarboxylate transporter 2/3/5
MSSKPVEHEPEPRPPYVRFVGLAAGLAFFGLGLLLPPPEGMSPAAWRVAAVALLMAIWWVTEALPVPVTALAPVVAFPLLGVAPIGDAAAPYANPLIFLFLGGFMIALALERWNLHRRIALNILGRFGARPSALVAGFLVATASLSMWVSNTATAVMMLPVGLSVIGLLHADGVGALSPKEDRNFAVALLLAIAYGASIGGLGTLIGTPPNALLAAYMAKTYGISVGFGQWMLLGVPMVMVMVPLAWLALTRLAFPVGGAAITGADRVIADERDALGPMSRQEKRVAVVFGATATLWVARPAINAVMPELSLSDPIIALLGAFALFTTPSDLRRGEFLLNWEWARRLPWDVLILFGGGLSLASGIGESGLAQWMGNFMTGGTGWPLFAIVLLVTVVVVFLTEITSNTATAAVFLPLAGAFALSIAVDPFVMMVPVALAASCAFMMPVATPPNAIVFGSGKVTVPQMVRAGFLLNLAAIFLIMVATYSLVLVVFGAVPDQMPPGRR